MHLFIREISNICGYSAASIREKIYSHVDEDSGDPLCISSMQQGHQNLNYAACHNCALLPETSCERFNIFLDRAALIGQEHAPELSYFAGMI